MRIQLYTRESREGHSLTDAQSKPESRRHGHADATLEGIRHFGTATKIVVAQPTDRSPLTDYVVRAPVRGCMSTGNLPTFGI